MSDYKARIDIARGIASLVPTSEAGETLIALADAVEALLGEDPALARRELSDLTEEYIALQEQHREALKALGESRQRFGDSETKRAELEAVIQQMRDVWQAGTDWPTFGEQFLRVLRSAPSVVLQDRDREVAARAWDELYATQFDGAVGVNPVDLHDPRNPYRADQDGEQS